MGTLPHCVRSSLETVPAEQEVQEAAPVCSAIEFAAHLVQIVTVLSRYVPALHSTAKFALLELDQYSMQINSFSLSDKLMSTSLWKNSVVSNGYITTLRPFFIRNCSC